MALTSAETAELATLKATVLEIRTTGRVTHIQEGDSITKYQSVNGWMFDDMQRRINELTALEAGEDNRCPIQIW